MFSFNSLAAFTKIQYVIFVEDEALQYPTSSLTSEYANLCKLRYFPTDLMQFKVNFDYFNYIKENDSSGIQVLFFNLKILEQPELFRNYLKVFQEMGRVTVFLFKYDFLNHVRLFITEITKSKIEFWYYNLYSSEKLIEITDQSRYFMDVDDFFKRLNRDAAKLSKYVANRFKYFKNIQLKFPAVTYVNDEYKYFRPIVNNVLNIFRADNISRVSYQLNWEKAPVENRQQLLLDSFIELDKIHLAWGEEKGLKASRVLPTAILVFPFHNPIYREMLSSDRKHIFSKLLLAEQTKDYIHNYLLEDDDDEDNFRKISEMLAPIQLDVMDGITYLHASFQFSPSLRFPIQSSKLNQDVAMFSLSKAKGIKYSTNRHKSILKLGKKLKNLYLEENLEVYLSQRNGQILVISDLPMEWMLIKGVPLGFLADVCRIQDSNINGYLLNYSMSSKMRFELNKDSVKNTLVIFSGSEVDKEYFASSIELAKKYQIKFGFNLAFANSKHEVRSLIEKFTPDILIFDCHGEFDKSDSRCYLSIGDDCIYSHDIVKEKLAAPVIYLSCCNTNPNYDSLDKLHDAFIQAGALTVTGTFLPLDMDRGTFAYLRIISLLASENERLASGNWLHFVSFCIRTSLIWEARRKCWIKNSRDLTASEESIFIALLEKLHHFESRSEVFTEFQQKGLKLSDEVILKIEDTNMEFMYYTHYGRPDLITFKN